MKKIYVGLLALLFSSCMKTSSELITYSYESNVEEINNEQECKLIYMASLNKKIEESKYIGQVHIQKSFFKKIPVMSEEIYLLQKSVKENLCAHAVKYVLMKFSPVGYLEKLDLYK
ncbi:hypothetical protein [Bacteriovorax sp. Seq25_V]|uniref:hypothetical protein n=1 Tax=Bacteriovorax sp. Seq25_V TaxID=1201288 RepID=UPI00038A14C9|nr:hypothetical protein [Bacteriovorax sp. Seq25_V]EQC47318.1 putative lipoprotein [Bacteriovorax sp. Seq25_V]